MACPCTMNSYAPYSSPLPTQTFTNQEDRLIKGPLKHLRWYEDVATYGSYLASKFGLRAKPSQQLFLVRKE